MCDNLPLTPHKRNVLKAWLDGKTIQYLDGGHWYDASFDSRLAFILSDDHYRIKPTPTRRWYTRDEFMALFASWPSKFLIKSEGEIRSAQLVVTNDSHYVLGSSNPYDVPSMIQDGHFKGDHYSHDGGKTWHLFGVEE